MPPTVVAPLAVARGEVTYTLYATDRSWAGARDYCGRFHDKLATVLSATDSELMTGLVRDAGVADKGVWLGGTALVDPSTYDGRGNGNGRDNTTDLSSWYWQPEAGLGSFASQFDNWAPNQPDNRGDGLLGWGAQYCLSMWTPPHVHAFKWRDRNCATPELFVCEDARSPPPPLPPSPPAPPTPPLPPVIPPPPLSPGQVAPFAVARGEVTYTLYATDRSWAGARDYCGRFHDKLATVLSATDSALMTGLVRDAGVTDKGVWLGGTALVDPSTYDGRGNGNGAADSTDLSSWHWYPEAGLGSFASQSFSNWAPNQPDRAGAQHCLSMWTPPHVHAFEWRDRNCATQELFVCEDARPSTGSSSTFALRAAPKGVNGGPLESTLRASASRVPSMPPASSLPAASSSILGATAGDVLGVHAAKGSPLDANALWVAFILAFVLCACLVHIRRRQRQRALRTSTSDTLPVMKPTESMRFDEASMPPPLEAVKSHEEDLGSKMIAALATGMAKRGVDSFPPSPPNGADRMADGTELPVYETQRVWLDKKLEHGIKAGLDSPMRYGQ